MKYLTSLFNGYIFSFTLLLGLCISSCSIEQPYAEPANTSPAYDNGNVIVAFFDEADLTIEMLDQSQVLERALRDMLTLTPNELREKRYSNYQLEPNKWTLRDILFAYYSARPAEIFDTKLYDDVVTSEAKAKIKQALNNLLQNRRLNRLEQEIINK